MTNLFRGHTQPTALQQAVEKATDGSQASEDWGLIMKICDHVGSHEESAKEVMKTIRKRLQTNPATHGWRTIELTLSLLESLTKNCGKIFHLQIAHKDFLKELKAVIGPKNNPSAAVQQRVLGMIQTWALAFRQDPDLKNVEHFYQECKHQGLAFPPAEPENIIKAAVPPTGTIERPSHYSQSNAGTMSRGSRPISDEASYPASHNQNMSAEQVAKLRSELDVVQTNAEVFGEMLVTLQPGEEDSQDFELLMELNNTCKQMQARIVELLAQVSIDDITVDLLRYNDELNNSFKTFENYMQERDRRFGATHKPPLNRTVSPPRTATSILQTPTKNTFPSSHNADNEPALIRFDDDPIPLTTGFQNLNMNPIASSAVPKNTFQQSTASATTRPVANNPVDPERDVREIEEWLKVQGDESDSEDQPRQESGTTDAFNNFLQKRASAVPAQATSDQPNYRNISINNNQQNHTHL